VELKSKLGLNKALDDIKTGKIFPVYLISGDESFLVKEATRRIAEAILPEKERATNLEVIEGENEDWERIIQSLSTYALFGSRRVVEVKDTRIFYSKFDVEKIIEKSKEYFGNNDIEESIKLFRIATGYLGLDDVSDLEGKRTVVVRHFGEDQKSQTWLKRMVKDCEDQNLEPIPYEDNSVKLEAYLKKEAERTDIAAKNILVLGTDYLDRRKNLYKRINDIGVVVDLSIERARRDPANIEEDEKRTLQLEAKGLLEINRKKLSQEAFETLANKTGYNLGIFINELEKVILSIKDREKIEAADIDHIVGRTKEDSIFDLQKAVGRRDFEQAAFFVKELVGQGEFYLVLLQGIASEVRHLIAAKDLIEKELKSKWNSKMDSESFKRYIYFPIILKIRKAKQEDPTYKKSKYNILKLPLNVLMELLENSENFTREELYLFLNRLAETDLKTKSTKVSPVHLVEEVLLQICSKESVGRSHTQYL
jgi:DNA polymerase-3 subunit delta